MGQSVFQNVKSMSTKTSQLTPPCLLKYPLLSSKHTGRKSPLKIHSDSPVFNVVFLTLVTCYLVLEEPTICNNKQ